MPTPPAATPGLCPDLGPYTSEKPTLATIGVYCFDAESFVATLQDAGVTLLVDVRQRRGVRGREYAWANATRLRQMLGQNGIDYVHHRELAPTTELRQLQYREDDRLGVGKRSRERLAPEYARRYTQEILDQTPLEPLVAEFSQTTIPTLFCVESAASACHRSLIAQRISERFGWRVVDLTPTETDQFTPGTGIRGAQRSKVFPKPRSPATGTSKGSALASNRT